MTKKERDNIILEIVLDTYVKLSNLNDHDIKHGIIIDGLLRKITDEVVSIIRVGNEFTYGVSKYGMITPDNLAIIIRDAVGDMADSGVFQKLNQTVKDVISDLKVKLTSLPEDIQITYSVPITIELNPDDFSIESWIEICNLIKNNPSNLLSDPNMVGIIERAGAFSHVIDSNNIVDMVANEGEIVIIRVDGNIEK